VFADCKDSPAESDAEGKADIEQVLELLAARYHNHTSAFAK
jgi:hypothetical protein